MITEYYVPRPVQVALDKNVHHSSAGAAAAVQENRMNEATACIIIIIQDPHKPPPVYTRERKRFSFSVCFGFFFFRIKK